MYAIVQNQCPKCENPLFLDEDRRVCVVCSWDDNSKHAKDAPPVEEPKRVRKSRRPLRSDWERENSLIDRRARAERKFLEKKKHIIDSLKLGRSSKEISDSFGIKVRRVREIKETLQAIEYGS